MLPEKRIRFLLPRARGKTLRGMAGDRTLRNLKNAVILRSVCDEESRGKGSEAPEYGFFRNTQDDKRF